MTRYQDKVVIVTGGANGIGKGIAEAFMHQKSKVIICDIDKKAGELVVENLNKISPGNVVYMYCDTTNEENVKKVVLETVKRFGSLDCLVNNSGVHPPPRNIDDDTKEEFNQLFKDNVLSQFLFSKHCLPYIRLNHGNVINIASIVAQIGDADSITYAATKGAIFAMTKAMAIDEAKHHVRVNSISPGATWTNMWTKFANGDKDLIKKGASCQLNGRFGTTKEIGNLAVYIASEATNNTGTDYTITGGAEISFAKKAQVQVQMPEGI